MSVNQFLDAVPFSVSGLQNLQVSTINGGGFITTINIAGQIAFLSWNSTTETLTLLIPNANGSITGLLTSTDWNIFNNKENLLTFASPLTRVGNTISFDFSIPNTFTGVNTFTNNTNFNNNIYLNALPLATAPNVLYIDGTGLVSYGVLPDLIVLNNTWTGTQTYPNDIYYTSGNYFYTGLPNAITTNSLYVDPITGQLSYGASTNILPLNNVFTGTNTFNNLVRISTNFIVENVNNTGLVMAMYRDKTNFPADYLSFNNSGDLGLTAVGSNGWLIDRNGNPTFNDTTTKTLEVIGGGLSPPMVIYRDKLNFPSDVFYYDNLGKLGHSTPTHVWTILPEGDADFSIVNVRARLGFVGNVFKVTRNVTTPFEFIYFDDVGTFGYNNGWSIQAGGGGVMTMPVVVTTNMICNNVTTRNKFGFSHFEPSFPTFNQWISAEFSYDGVDKPVIGNLGLVLGGFGACFGAHDTTLGAWRPCWINPGDITYIANLVVTNSFTPPSDKRLKGDISYLDAGKSIAFIKRLKPCIYKRIDKLELPNYTHPEQKLQHGFLADDVEEVAETEAQKALVGRMKFAGFDDCKNLAILNLIPEIVQANKEMIDKIEKLETENNTLLERIDAIELKMKTLVKLLGISI